MSHFSHVLILGIAEILSDSIITFDDIPCFSPSPDEPALSNYDYTDEEATVLAVHSLVRRASLPVDTFILAALILRRLTPEFYDEWCETMSPYNRFPTYNGEQTKEVVIVAAIV
jgi:hypothetical protein